jgi:hypothetical protein
MKLNKEMRDGFMDAVEKSLPPVPGVESWTN